MGYCDQGWSDAWRPGAAWIWAVLGSLLAHGLLVAWMVAIFKERPSRPRVVVPVEAIALVPPHLGPKGGGGGQPAPVTRPEPVAPKPAPRRPQPQPRVKPQPPPKVKVAPPPPPEPPEAPVIHTPAPTPAVTTAKPSSIASVPGTASASGSGQGGSGVGRGTGSGGGVGPGQGRGSGPGSSSGSALQSYLRLVRQLLEKQKDYPSMARQRNIQGVVIMRFTILAGGQVKVSGISRSSGQDLLDEAALKTIRRVGQFPPLPADLNRQQLTVEVPLAFRLRND